jgi:hypothetical protein
VRGAKKPEYPGIHCHVFDEHNTKELFELIFEDVTVDVIKQMNLEMFWFYAVILLITGLKKSMQRF